MGSRDGVRLADRFDAFLVDLDGVVYVGDRALPGAPEALRELRTLGKGIAFVTNDPFGSRAGYVARLAAHGVAADEAEIFTSAAATAAEVARRHGPGAAVYAIASDAFRAELETAALRCVAPADSQTADAVVVGWHPGFHFDELRHATRAVLAGVPLYATNRDPVFPMPDAPWPGTGALVAAVETATGRTATVVGKPEPFLFELARRGLSGRIAVVGDRLDTDVAGGRRAGLATILVAPDAPAGGTGRPDYVVRGLAEILRPG